jgi:hypothetical protein
MHARVAPITRVPISPGKTFAGYLLNIKNAPILEIDKIENKSPFPEFHRMLQIKRNREAIKQVPEPSPLYPSNIFTVFAKATTTNGIIKGYIRLNLVLPMIGITGEPILIKLK